MEESLYVQIAKRRCFRVGDVIAIYGNAYKITHITDTDVLGKKVVENGIHVHSTLAVSLDLTLEGWRLTEGQ